VRFSALFALACCLPACGGEETTLECSDHRSDCDIAITVCEETWVQRNAIGSVSDGDRLDSWLEVGDEEYHCDDPNDLPAGCAEAQVAAEEAAGCDG